MTEHSLKTWPGPFEAVERGEKRHEVRRNDRGFEEGDTLVLREWVPVHVGRRDDLSRYTGRELRVRVTYLTRAGTWGLPPDLCVMSIERI